MTDTDVESIEGKKLRHATIERMARKWRDEVRFPRAHLEHVTGEGDQSLLVDFHHREKYAPHNTLAGVLARWEITEIVNCIRYPQSQYGALNRAEDQHDPEVAWSGQR